MSTPKAIEISLRPYKGRLWFAPTKEAYEKAVKRLLKEEDRLTCDAAGRFAAGEGPDGLWTYIVWANSPPTLAHEMSHVVLHVFERSGIDPTDGGDEPFCYLLQQLMEDALKHLPSNET